MKRGIQANEVLPVTGCSRSEMADSIRNRAVSEFAYRSAGSGVEALTFSRSIRPGWATAMAVATGITGFGLLFLLVRRPEDFRVLFEENHAGLRIRIAGHVDPKLLDEIRAQTSAAPATTIDAALFRDARGGQNRPTVAPANHGISPQYLPANPAPTNQHGVSPQHGISPQHGVPNPPPPPPSPFSSTPAPPPRPPAPAPAPRPNHPAPAPPPPHNPAPPPSPPPPPARPDPTTRLVSTPRSPTFLLDSGEILPISARTLIGRDPEPAPGEQATDLVAIVDPSSSVSKTHLVVGFENDTVWIADRHSTNGTTVVDLTQTEHAITPGEWVSVEPGTQVRIGSRLLTLEYR